MCVSQGNVNNLILSENLALCFCVGDVYWGNNLQRQRVRKGAVEGVSCLPTCVLCSINFNVQSASYEPCSVVRVRDVLGNGDVCESLEGKEGLVSVCCANSNRSVTCVDVHYELTEYVVFDTCAVWICFQSLNYSCWQLNDKVVFCGTDWLNTNNLNTPCGDVVGQGSSEVDESLSAKLTITNWLGCERNDLSYLNSSVVGEGNQVTLDQLQSWVTPLVITDNEVVSGNTRESSTASNRSSSNVARALNSDISREVVNVREFGVETLCNNRRTGNNRSLGYTVTINTTRTGNNFVVETLVELGVYCAFCAVWELLNLFTTNVSNFNAVGEYLNFTVSNSQIDLSTKCLNSNCGLSSQVDYSVRRALIGELETSDLTCTNNTVYLGTLSNVLFFQEVTLNVRKNKLLVSCETLNNTCSTGVLTSYDVTNNPIDSGTRYRNRGQFGEVYGVKKTQFVC